jgi:hypothetical protein
LVLARYQKLMYGMAGLPEPVTDRYTLQSAVFARERVFGSKILGIKYALVRDPEGLFWVRSTWFMPRASLVRHAVIEPSAEAQLRVLERPDFNPERTILFAAPPPAPSKTAGARAEDVSPAGEDGVAIVEYRPSRIALRAQATSAAYLVLSELDYPGWRAYVNGEEVPIVRADYLLRAISLPAGRHEVSFVYRPWTFGLGAALSGMTLLVLLAAAMRKRFAG